MALITKIKEYRENAGLKQSELADQVGTRRETIVHLENGKYNPSLKLAMDIFSTLPLKTCSNSLMNNSLRFLFLRSDFVSEFSCRPDKFIFVCNQHFIFINGCNPHMYIRVSKLHFTLNRLFP